jgi:hypothetical protein
MFQLSVEEAVSSRSHFATLKTGRGSNVKYLPYAFTEHGVAMLSSVLGSKQAIQVNIAIIRAFIEMRRMIAETQGLSEKLVEHEKRITGLTSDVRNLFDLLQPLLDAPAQAPGKIGFDPRA